MGGRALSFETRRVNKETYDKYVKEVIPSLAPYCKKAIPTRAYKNKKDFGDLDILVNSWSKKKGQSPYEVITDLFSPKEIFKNGNCYSFDYNDFQIDLILFSEELFESSYFYYSFNDLNNFVGKIYHNLGFKFGHRGLSFSLIRGHRKKEILLTRNSRQIYEIIGLDYDAWKKGFDSLEDIYNFVTKSPYFSTNYYEDSMMNHRTRVRDKKRSTFKGFKAYLEENHIHKIYHPSPSDFFNILILFRDQAPLKEISNFYKKALRDEELAKKFNGRHVMEWTGLKGKELGEFLGTLPKDLYASSTWDKKAIKEDVIERYYRRLWPSYGMFREEGNKLIHEKVKAFKVEFKDFLEDDPDSDFIGDMIEEEIVKPVEKMKGFAEAGDTEVRESIWWHLTNEE
jgi:hypothetical protein